MPNLVTATCFFFLQATVVAASPLSPERHSRIEAWNLPWAAKSPAQTGS